MATDTKVEDEFEVWYGWHIDIMIYLGCWVIDTENPVKRFLYAIHSHEVTFWASIMLCMGVLDLIDSIPDLGKIFYNFSFNILIFGCLIKCLSTVHQARRVNVLRGNLYRSVKSCKDDEELGFYDSAVGELKFISKLFFSLLWWLYPTWLLLSIFSDYLGERKLPLPAKWPWGDISDLSVFIPVCLFHGVFAGCYLHEVVALEISLLGLLMQLYREYRFLIKSVREFGEFYENGCLGEVKSEKNKVVEINCVLKRAKARRMLGDIIVRQKQLIQFTEDLETCYNQGMFVHIFLGGVLMVVNGVYSMIVSSTFNLRMGYQYGYVFAVICDTFCICWLTNRVSIKCQEVGTAFYSTPWYIMDADIQRDISLVILRTQKPPKVTAGTFVELNLDTFMAVMKNMYSWLALFRQVALK